MKLLIVFFIALFTTLNIASTNSYAQQPWELMGPIGFNAIQKLSDGRIISCTDAGSLYSSTDDGASWSHHLINPKRGFFCMKFFDLMHGMMGAAPNGFVEITTDGGKTWNEKYVSDGYIKSLACPSIDTAYILADPSTCFRTTNGGRTWDSLHVPTNMLLYKIVFSDTRNGFIAGDSATLFHTTDAGMTWNRILVPNSITLSIVTIDTKSNNKVIFGTSDAQIGTSSDNGAHWNIKSFQNIDTLKAPIDIVKIIGQDTIVAFQSGVSYFRLLSTDFGLTWKPFALYADKRIDPVVSFSNATDFNDLYVDELGNGYAVGSWGTLYRIRNYGINSPKVFSDLQHHCAIGIGTSPFVLSDGFLLLEALQNNTNFIHAAAHYGPLCFSSDGGITWFSREDGNYGLNSYFGLHFTSENNGILFVGSDYTVSTTNNGVSWNNLSLPIGPYTNSFVQSSGEIYLTQDSIIYKSTDGGYTTTLFSGYHETVPRDNLRKILVSVIGLGYVFNNDTIYIEVTTQDSIFIHTKGFVFTHEDSFNLVVTTDGGKHWSKRFVFPDSLVLNMLAFANPQIGVAVLKDTAGRFVVTMRTTDAGFHWDILPKLQTGNVFQDMKFNKSGTVGIALGNSGDMWVTLDAGNTWIRDSLTYFVDLSLLSAQSTKIVFTDDTTAMIISDVGFWRKTFTSIKSSVENKESELKPSLNITTYPSPTSGSNIHCNVGGLYSVIPESVSLNLLDILGREVMDLSLIVQKNSNGTFSSFDFPTSPLSIGVYTLILGTSRGGLSTNVIVVK